MTYFPILEISTTVGCRMACSYCPQSVHVRRYSETGATRRKLSFGDFESALKNVPNSVRICFAGMAEPWLNQDATRMVVLAKERGHEVAIYTTLSGMSSEDLLKLSRHSFAEFVVHLPDDAGEMHLKIDDRYLSLLNECRGLIPHHYSVIGPLHRDLRSIVGPVSDDSSGIYSRAGNLKDRKIVRKTGRLACSACGPKIDHNVMLPSGDVVLCCQDYSVKHTIGNLLRQPWDSLFEGDAYRQIMQGLAGDESIDIACRYCELAVPAN